MAGDCSLSITLDLIFINEASVSHVCAKMIGLGAAPSTSQVFVFGFCFFFLKKGFQFSSLRLKK